MNKEKELHRTNKIVEEILTNDKMARNSDNHLFLQVYQYIANQKGINIQCISIPSFFNNMSIYGFPSTETIRRSRQKIQEKHPELRSDKQVLKEKQLNEAIFRDFALK